MIGRLLGNWKYLAIAGLFAAASGFYALWQGEVRAHAKDQGEWKAMQVAAEMHRKEQIAIQERVVRDVSLAWDASLPGVRAAAVANYIHRFGGAPRLCPAADPAGLRLDLSNATDPVPATTEGSEVHAGGEPEQLACTSEFISACGEDALARKLTREWALRNNLQGE